MTEHEKLGKEMISRLACIFVGGHFYLLKDLKRQNCKGITNHTFFADVDKISDMFGINSDTLTLNNNLIKSEDVTSLLEVTPPSSGASFAVNNQAGSNWINSSRDSVTVQEFKEEFTGLHSPATPGGTAVAPASNVMMSAACWGSNSSTGMCQEFI